MQRNATSRNHAPNLLALRRHYTNPHGLYDVLRTRSPIHFDTSSQSWIATGHKVIAAILDDTRFIASTGPTTGIDSIQKSSIGKQMLFMNGDVHRRTQDVMLRPLAHMVKQMPGTIHQIADDALQDVCKTGSMDVVSEFASPISLFTIAHVLGLPTSHLDLLHELESWSDTFGDVTSGYFRGDMQDVTKLEAYFYQLVAEKKNAPANDLLSAFIAAHHIFLDDEDLVANCMMVFAAGRITTKKLLGNGLSLLLPSWELHQREFQANSRYTRMLCEELLRMVTPTRYLIREANTAVHLFVDPVGEHMIDQGQRVLLFLEAANYDPEVFHHPEVFEAQRRPNKHLAFGYGPHQCPGAALARVEIQIALEKLLQLPALRADPKRTPTWNSNPNLGGFTSNPVVFVGTC